MSELSHSMNGIVIRTKELGLVYVELYCYNPYIIFIVYCFCEFCPVDRCWSTRGSVLRYLSGYDHYFDLYVHAYYSVVPRALND